MRRRPYIGPSESQSAADAAARRELVSSPHKAAHDASVRAVRSAPQPKKWGELVSWFFHEWGNEEPIRIHVNEVWRDYVSLTDDREAEGGSLLGSHKLADDFRRFIEDSPHQTDDDGYYQRPLRSAIARLCGRGHSGPTKDLGPAPFMARFLFRYGSTADLQWASSSMGIPPQVAETYAERALTRLYRLYTVSPNLLNSEAA